jgi:hypothetical protein
MIKHIVMWRLKDYAEGGTRAENALKMKKMLEDLQGQIPGLIRVEVGIDFLGSEQSFDVVLYTEFTSKESLELYQSHPLHRRAGEFIGAVREARAVVDFEV